MYTSIFQTEDDPDYGTNDDDDDDDDDDELLTALRLRAMSRNPPAASSGRRTARGGASSSSGTATVQEAEAAAANIQQAGDPWQWPDGLVPGLVTQAMPSDECWDKVVAFLSQQEAIVTQETSTRQQDSWRQVGRDCAIAIWQELQGACACEASQATPCPRSCLTPCPACAAFRKVEALDLPELCLTETQAKNRRLASLLKASVTIFTTIGECGGPASKHLVSCFCLLYFFVCSECHRL